MRAKELVEGLEVAIGNRSCLERKYVRAKKAVIMSVGNYKYSWLSGIGTHIIPASDEISVAVAQCDGYNNWTPKLVSKRDILCTWTTYQAAREVLERETAEANRLAQEQQKLQDDISAAFQEFGLHTTFGTIYHQTDESKAYYKVSSISFDLKDALAYLSILRIMRTTKEEIKNEEH